MKKKIALVVATMMLLVGGSSTVAWLFYQDQMTNQFVTAQVTGAINETFPDQTVKKDVCITNNSDIPVYIRVALVPTWMTGGKPTALRTEGTYALSLNDTGNWRVGSDGYYYYTLPVKPSEKTASLIRECKVLSMIDPIYKGKQFRLDVVASMIQATPEAVKDAWGVTVRSDQSLQIP